MKTGSDYSLGQQIAALCQAQRASDLPPSSILSQVQDLLGSDTTLLGPLRDLLVRPAYRQLLHQGGADGAHSSLLAGRDALLQDLALTYHPAVVARLAAVIDGSLGLQPLPSPTATQAPQPRPNPAAVSWPAAAPGVSPVPPSVPPSVAPASWSAPSAPAMPLPVPPQPPAPSGPAPVTALLIALVSMLTGAVLLALGWMLLSSRPQLQSGAAPPSAPSAQTPAPAPGTPAPPPTPKGPTTIMPPSSSDAWGGPSEYKFGQLPGGDYPNSCAFSVTDANGRTTTDKSQVEYWACRDVGGDPETGYRVVWADGKETNYTFQSGGDGQVVGTNGSTYPMRWRNDTHQGDPIVVINHQDGAITWIPGQIN